METFNWYYIEYHYFNHYSKMKIRTWNKSSESKLRGFMTEIVGLAWEGALAPKSWRNLVVKYKINYRIGTNIPKAMIKLGYMTITPSNHLAWSARNWEFIPDGQKVYQEAKAMRVKTLADAPLDLTPIKSDEEQEIENLKAKLAMLQKEIEERQAAFEKKNRLSKTGKEILEMFNLSVDELKEIVSIL